MVLRIKELLKEKRCTGKALAERIGINRVTMINIINGKNNPSFDTLIKIADALGVPVWRLFASPEDVSPRDLIAFIHYQGKSHIPTSFDQIMAILKECDEALFQRLCRNHSFQYIRERYVEDKDIQCLMDNLCALIEEPCDCQEHGKHNAISDQPNDNIR